MSCTMPFKGGLHRRVPDLRFQSRLFPNARRVINCTLHMHASAQRQQHVYTGSPKDRVSLTLTPFVCLASTHLQVRGPIRRYSEKKVAQDAQTRQPLRHRAVIALGSNIGRRLAHLEHACTLLESRGDVAVKRTSCVYETAAMYVTDQRSFYNAVVEVWTSLEPLALLDWCLAVEDRVGRRREGVVAKGPRVVDLDVLLYGEGEAVSEGKQEANRSLGTIVQLDRLQVPHALMLEREFVLRPLCDLIPYDMHPHTPGVSYAEHLDSVADVTNPPTTITPLAPHLPPLTALLPTRRTQVMSVLNLTPDSFSDGGMHAAAAADPQSLAALIESQHLAGASIVDIGGQSTRPNAVTVGAEEEIARIIPSVRAISSLIASQPTLPKPAPAISVDTYRAAVAEAAVAAGAHIINDVSGGMLDPEMLPTLARLGCTVVLMHMRGDPTTMTSKENTSYPDGLFETVARELLARVQAAEAAGIKRWRIILDPGIGFAKTSAQNPQLLRSLGQLRQWEGLRGLPWLVGTSRKNFIGVLTGVKEPRDRGWGTAAAVTAAVQGGADIVRVHDVQEMAQVACVADAIWRA